jgi:hypothetical protein
MLSQNDLKLITMNLVNRKRFMYTVSDIVSYVLNCICLRKIKFRKFSGSKEEWRKTMKKHYQYDEGEDKLQDELDVVTLLKTIRRVKIISNIVMT